MSCGMGCMLSASLTACLLAGCGNPRDTWKVGIGAKGTLNSGATYTAVLDSKESFGRWMNAEIQQDNHAKTLLAASGHALLVPSGAAVSVLELGDVSVPGAVLAVSRVRILDGPNAYSGGWAAASQVVEQTQSRIQTSEDRQAIETQRMREANDLIRRNYELKQKK